MFNKKQLSERDICTKFITPALKKAGWKIRTQVREEVTFTDGRIIVQGKMYTRGRRKRADVSEMQHEAVTGNARADFRINFWRWNWWGNERTL